MNTVAVIVGIIVGLFTIGGAIAAFAALFVKFSQALDRNTIAINNINETIKAQWVRIDEHGEALDDHGNRLTKVETCVDMHLKGVQ